MVAREITRPAEKAETRPRAAPAVEAANSAGPRAGYALLKFKLPRSEHGLGKSFTAFHYAEAMTRFETLRKGVPATFVDDIASEMGRSREWLLSLLGLSVATINRRKADGKPLSTVDGESVMGMARLIGQVQAMVEESGEPSGFNAARWLAGWIDGPVPAMGWRKPSAFLDTAEGMGIVSDTLARMQNGAYA